MKKTSSRILFFGNERLATATPTLALTLRALIKASYDIGAVVVAQKEVGASRKSRPLEIAEVAAEHGIPVIAPAKLSEAQEQLAAYNAVAGVLVAYGKIVPQSIIDLFPSGIINIHPSLLPKHRGSTPIESAILDGDQETGVSLMQLTAKMDAGPVYAQTKLPLGPKPFSKELLAYALLSQGSDLLIEHLPAILDGSLQPIAQDENEATYDKLIQKKDGIIDWQKSADQLFREILAYKDWPRSQTMIGNKQIIITAAKVLDMVGAPGALKLDDGRLVMFCKWGALEIERLIPSGKKEMTAQAFLAGHTP